MRKFRVVGLTLVAAFALCAFAASSAFAVEESRILVGGNLVGVGGIPFEASGELELHNLVLGLDAVLIDCLGILDGTIAEGGVLGLVEDLLNLSGEVITELGAPSELALSCEVLTSLNSECGPVGGLASLYPMGLNLGTGTGWHVEVVLSGANFLILFLNEGEPGYHVVCSNGKENLCGQNSTTSGLLTTGIDILATFGEEAGTETEEVACTTGTGMLLGMGDITSTSGTLSLSFD
jgi:hypothetical protein